MKIAELLFHGHGSDVTVVVAGKEFKCHSYVLSAKSTYFNQRWIKKKEILNKTFFTDSKLFEIVHSDLYEQRFSTENESNCRTSLHWEITLDQLVQLFLYYELLGIAVTSYLDRVSVPSRFECVSDMGHDIIRALKDNASGESIDFKYTGSGTSVDNGKEIVEKLNEWFGKKVLCRFAVTNEWESLGARQGRKLFLRELCINKQTFFYLPGDRSFFIDCYLARAIATS